MSGRIISFLRRKATKPPKFSLDIPVCDTVPQIHILGHPASFSFIIDTTKIEIGEINADGLGMLPLQLQFFR